MSKLICKVEYCKHYDDVKEGCSLDEVVIDLHSGYSDNIARCCSFEDTSPRCHRCEWANPLSASYRTECMRDGNIRSSDDSCRHYEAKGEQS